MFELVLQAMETHRLSAAVQVCCSGTASTKHRPHAIALLAQAAGCQVLGLMAEVAYPRRWTDMQRTTAEIKRVRHEREGKRGPPPRPAVIKISTKSIL